MVSFSDFPYICRFCLKTDDLLPLSKISEAIISIVNPILILKEESSAELPENVCKSCFDFLENIAKFVELFQSNTEKLKEILDTLKNDGSSGPDYPLSDEEYTESDRNLPPSSNNTVTVKQTLNPHICHQTQKRLCKPDKTQNRHICEMCGKIFTRGSGLQRHMKIHLGVKPFECAACGKTFVEKATLSRHSLIHSGEKPFGCSLCGKLSRRKDQAVEHVMKYHPNVTNIDFVLYDHHLTKESKAETDDQLTPEKNMPKVDSNSTPNTNSPETSRKNFKTKKRVEICQCTLCGKVFQRRGYLKNHMAIHAVKKPYSCKICNKGFTQRHALIRHNLVHTKERPFQCNLCGKTFTRKDTLTEHLKNHDSNKQYICFHCGKYFENKYYLAKHLKYYLSGVKEKNNRKEKKSTCPHCGKQLHSRAYLKVHLLTHSGEKPFECEICGNKFTILRSLKNHLNIHKGIKPYQCKQCDKAFRTAGSLKKHEFLHTGDRPYKCTTCNKGFIRRSHLKRHIRSH